MELITFSAGFALAIVFAILWLNHNFKTRPDWVFAKLAKYAGKIETQPWYDDMLAHLRLAKQKLDAANRLMD
ncbi:hypothetical protein [Methylibium sp.]|uniref:hypothetical protein n=1 Tax=Methylibium sp. TaxID=2067992 RepID=UPI003D14EF25